MANLSDAGVDIVVENVGDEFLAYVEATNKNTTDYAIIYDGYDTHTNANGDLVVSGGSSGRWAYSNNLEGYFDPNHVERWLGVNSDYSWLQDEEKKKQYRAETEKSYKAYQNLIKAIKEKDGRVEINYTDCDPAMDWMGSGGAVLELQDGEVVFSQSFDDEEFTIANYAEQQGESEYWALEYLRGDEVAEAFSEYLDECKKEGKEAVDVDTWYDTIYEEED